MNSTSLKTTLVAMAIILFAACLFQTRSAQSSSSAISQVSPKPLLLEENEGERRIWREPPPGDFVLKVSPKNNGSQHLVMGTEDMAPGDEFPAHRHLKQDEILFIVKGTVHAHVGDQEGDLHAGGTVFIPANTWVDVKNAASETASVVFVFSAPGFEDYMRCDSVLPNEKVIPLSIEQQRACSHLGHVIYRDLEENPKNKGLGVTHQTLSRCDLDAHPPQMPYRRHTRNRELSARLMVPLVQSMVGAFRLVHAVIAQGNFAICYLRCFIS